MLTVYRASAGSGKTHLLTGTYLKMLFTQGTSFSNILAVTFTNKATEEMKHRIIEQLYVLSSSPQNSDYIDMIIGECKRQQLSLAQSEQPTVSVSDIQKRAKSLLVSILHDYSNFYVSTIDSFFQQTTRSFTREIGLQGGYQIELDSEKVRQQAIDNMLAELEKDENSQLLDWLVRFAGERIESGKKWDFKNDLLEISKEILKEDFKKNSSQINLFTADKTVFADYIREIKEIKDSFESHCRQLGQRAMNFMNTYNITLADFSYGNSSGASVFLKWAKGEYAQPGSRTLAMRDNLAKWCTSKASAETKAKMQEAYPHINDCICEGIDFFSDNLPAYLSAVATLTYIYTFGVISDISLKMHDYARENNLMLISDTTELLNKIIDGSDTPFVYEKIGTRFQHFMIDEFQDTSGMQWENFKPLISDSLGNDYDNLIVGDVKQSIYRWRNSDWNLLHSGLREFAQGMRKDENLDTNWRSCRNIVEFNNAFFQVAANLLQSKFDTALSEAKLPSESTPDYPGTIRMAYADTFQKVPQKKDTDQGHVQVCFIDEDNTDDYIQASLQTMAEAVTRFIANGYRQKDIAILVRKGAEGQMVADYLLQNKFYNEGEPVKIDIISNEALLIGSSPAISAIISVMRYLYNSTTIINSQMAGINITAASSADHNISQALDSWFSADSSQKDYFHNKVAQQAQLLRSMPLFEMVEKIIDELIDKSNASDMVYAQAFQDLVLDFTTSNTADLSAFIKWWDEYGIKKTITTPDTQDAIRIMTIHKSKGLGFKAVIIPFATWNIDHGNIANIIWCKPQVEPFSKIPLVPVRYSSSLASTIYKDDYFNEKRQAFIDNLNTAYVAFTRAKEELVIISRQEKKPENLATIGSVLLSAGEWAAQPTDAIASESIDLREHYQPGVLEIGQWCRKEGSDAISNELKMAPYISVNPSERLQLRLHGKGYFNDSKERQYGTLMHDILSEVRTIDDLEPAVFKRISSGDIQQEESLHIIEKLSAYINSEIAREWFAPGNEIINETEILIADGSFLRPDRIIHQRDVTISTPTLFDDTVTGDLITVVDYKFGSHKTKSHIRQVASYMQQLSAMGFKNIRGFLWYVELEEKIAIQSVS